MRMELHDKGLVLSAPEIPGEPYLFRLAGKDRGEKGHWGTVWCVLRVRF